MDRSMLRNRAKAKYKEITKGLPKHQRAPFAMMFPMIKAMILAEGVKTETGTEVNLTTEDQALLDDMMEHSHDAEHIHDENCNHEH